jgi:hypothetical protein
VLGVAPSGLVSRHVLAQASNVRDLAAPPFCSRLLRVPDLDGVLAAGKLLAAYSGRRTGFSETEGLERRPILTLPAIELDRNSDELLS